MMSHARGAMDPSRGTMDPCTSSPVRVESNPVGKESLSTEGGQTERRGRSCPSWNPRDFPTLQGNVTKKAKERGFPLPLDASKRGFKSTAAAKFFPFESVNPEKVKLKAIPIEFRWSSNGNKLSGDNDMVVTGGEKVVEVKAGKDGHVDRWFWPPPKVKITTGILGSDPATAYASKIGRG